MSVDVMLRDLQIDRERYVRAFCGFFLLALEAFTLLSLEEVLLCGQEGGTR